MLSGHFTKLVLKGIFKSHCAVFEHILFEILEPSVNKEKSYETVTAFTAFKKKPVSLIIIVYFPVFIFSSVKFSIRIKSKLKNHRKHGI